MAATRTSVAVVCGIGIGSCAPRHCAVRGAESFCNTLNNKLLACQRSTHVVTTVKANRCTSTVPLLGRVVFWHVNCFGDAGSFEAMQCQASFGRCASVVPEGPSVEGRPENPKASAPNGWPDRETLVRQQSRRSTCRSWSNEERQVRCASPKRRPAHAMRRMLPMKRISCSSGVIRCRSSFPLYQHCQRQWQCFSPRTRDCCSCEVSSDQRSIQDRK